jgi:N-acetylglucosaminyl-diphospho-decaprenol L-rhamnosyltransferase
LDRLGFRPTLIAVVVYFRTPKHLSAALDALWKQTLLPLEIVVVDNSSVLEGRTGRPTSRSDFRWVRAEHNLGYGAACNLGASLADSEYVLFLNADVSLERHACERLILAAENAPDVAIVGPRVIGADGSIELSARSFPNITTGMLGRSSLVTRLLQAVGRTPAGVSRSLGPSGEVDWVSGACMLIRRIAFEQVGGFDETYWMYWEDADICRRLSDRRWRIALCTAAEARHNTGSSGSSELTIAAFHDSAALYYERHVARTSAAALFARSLLRARKRFLLRRDGRTL